MPSAALRSARAHSSSSGPRRAETALYVARLSGELSGMAKQAKLEMVAYFLDMAQMEANSAAFDDNPAHSSW